MNAREGRGGYIVQGRAPTWMQSVGLDWAHRLWSEPRSLASRYVRTNGEFIPRAAIEIASARRPA